jgi:hypothetical protein
MRIENETSWSTSDIEAMLAQAYEVVASEDRVNRVDGLGAKLLCIKHWGGASLTIKVKRTRTRGIWELKIPRPKRILPNAIERLALVGAGHGDGMPNEWKIKVAKAAMHVVAGQPCDIRHNRYNRKDPAWDGKWGTAMNMRALPKKLGRGTVKAQMLLDIANEEHARWQEHIEADNLRRLADIAELEANLEKLKAKQPKNKKKQTA